MTRGSGRASKLLPVRTFTERALEALSRARTPHAVAGALEALPPDEGRVREVLLEKYAALTAEGPRKDPGFFMRSALLSGLMGRASAADTPLLEAALWTYEFIPPNEVAKGLRAAALLVLGELDDELAGYHSVRLLGDPHTSPMSGEPAVTAARLLAAQRQVLPLYQRLTLPGTAPEVAAECLHALEGAPASLIRRLAEEYAGASDGLVLLALVDLLTGHAQAATLAQALLSVVEQCPDLDVVRYAAMTVVAGRKSELIDALRERASLEGPRGELVREALSLLPA
jgi:hypothetical protein